MAYFNTILSLTGDNADYTDLVSVADAKLWCAISGNSFDSIVSDCIATAGKQCEDYANVSFIKREFVCEVQNVLGDVRLPMRPVVSITSVKNLDDDTVDYKMMAGMVKDPLSEYLKVTYQAGYENNLPEVFITAIKNQVLWLFSNRGDETKNSELNPDTMKLLKPYRVV